MTPSDILRMILETHLDLFGWAFPVESRKAELLLRNSNATTMELKRAVEEWNRLIALLNPESEADEGIESKPNNRGKNVNARMLEKLLKDEQSGTHECFGWTARQWATHLKCSAPSVVETKTWKMLQIHRDTLKAERATDRHRRAKGSDQRKRREQD